MEAAILSLPYLSDGAGILRFLEISQHSEQFASFVMVFWFSGRGVTQLRIETGIWSHPE